MLAVPAPREMGFSSFRAAFEARPHLERSFKANTGRRRPNKVASPDE